MEHPALEEQKSFHHIFTRELAEDEVPAFQRLKELWFTSPNLRPVVDLEGYKPPYEKGEVCRLGCRAGPEVLVANLAHEMGHLIDIDDDRVLRHGWGLDYPTQVIMGRSYPEPTTWQGCKRETRVVAIQSIILDLVGLDGVRKSESHVASMTFLVDFCYVPKRKFMKGSKRFPIKNHYCGALDRSRVHFLWTKFHEYRDRLDPEWVKEEWKRKVQLIDVRMSKKEAV